MTEDLRTITALVRAPLSARDHRRGRREPGRRGGDRGLRLRPAAGRRPAGAAGAGGLGLVEPAAGLQARCCGMAAHVAPGKVFDAAGLRHRPHLAQRQPRRADRHGPRPADDLGRAVRRPLWPGDHHAAGLARRSAVCARRRSTCTAPTTRSSPSTPPSKAAARLPAGDRTAYYADGWHLLLRDKQGHASGATCRLHPRPGRALPSGAPPIPGAATLAARRRVNRSSRPMSRGCDAGPAALRGRPPAPSAFR